MEELHLRRELKEKFLRDLDPSERLFFLKRAKEAILHKGYQASEDLFYYCYYIVLRERFRRVSPERDDGMLRFLLVEGKKEVEEAIQFHEKRLEETKSQLPDERGEKFMEFLSE